MPPAIYPDGSLLFDPNARTIRQYKLAFADLSRAAGLADYPDVTPERIYRARGQGGKERMDMRGRCIMAVVRTRDVEVSNIFYTTWIALALQCERRNLMVTLRNAATYAHDVVRHYADTE